MSVPTAALAAVQERCVQARFEDDQRFTVSYMNAMDSEVSTSDFTDPCMVTFTNPWTGEVHDPQTTNEIAREAPVDDDGYEEDEDEDTDYYDGDDAVDALDDEFDYDDEDAPEFVADYGDDTTEGVYYGDEITDAGIGVADEAGIGVADEAGIGEADAAAIGNAAFQSQTSAAGGVRGAAAAAVAAVVVAMCAVW